MSIEESLAIQNTRFVKNTIENPYTFQLCDDILVAHYTSSDRQENVGYYTYVNYFAPDAYGSMVRDVAVFRDYDYLGSLFEIDDKLPKLLYSDQQQTNRTMIRRERVLNHLK